MLDVEASDKPKIPKTIYLSEEAIGIMNELSFYYNKPKSVVVDELVISGGNKILAVKRLAAARAILAEASDE